MEIKNRPSFARTIKYRGTTLLSYRPLGRDLNRLKSLGDITVAPVVPTVSSAHRSQNELHWGITVALHRPAILWSFSPNYSFCSNAFNKYLIEIVSQFITISFSCQRPFFKTAKMKSPSNKYKTEVQKS